MRFSLHKPPVDPTPTFEQELESLADDLFKVAGGWFAPGPAQLTILSTRALDLLERFQLENREESA